MQTVSQLALTGAQVRLFVDGNYFLTHLDALPAARVAATCRRCDGVVRVTPLMGEQRVLVSCDCRAGEVQTHQPLELAPLLAALGWDLACAHCGETLRGDNHQTATFFTVTCPCTSRAYTLPTA